jgi:hypothetical protein
VPLLAATGLAALVGWMAAGLGPAALPRAQATSKIPNNDRLARLGILMTHLWLIYNAPQESYLRKFDQRTQVGTIRDTRDAHSHGNE